MRICLHTSNFAYVVTLTSKMTTTALDVLCGEFWNHDASGYAQLKFHKDGTGEVRILEPYCFIRMLSNLKLILRQEMIPWIGVQTEWKSLGEKPLDQIIFGGDNSDDVRILAQFGLEITLTKRAITTRGPTTHLSINDDHLSDDAFILKKFHVRLEKGDFTPALETKTGHFPPWDVRFTYRLVFDKSPFPPNEEWKNPEDSPQMEAFPFSEWKEFCNRRLRNDEE